MSSPAIPTGQKMVKKDGAVLPQTTRGNLFTVYGLIAVNNLVGNVTTACPADQGTAQLDFTPSGGSAVTLSAATTISSSAIKTQFVFTHDFSQVMIVTGVGATEVAPTALGRDAILQGTGTIGVTTNASKTGAVEWSLVYTPLSPGAYVEAA